MRLLLIGTAIEQGCPRSIFRRSLEDSSAAQAKVPESSWFLAMLMRRVLFLADIEEDKPKRPRKVAMQIGYRARYARMSDTVPHWWNSGSKSSSVANGTCRRCIHEHDQPCDTVGCMYNSQNQPDSGVMRPMLFQPRAICR